MLAGVLTLPLLLLLYFLKLRRRPRPVGSTLLWQKSIEDLQVNAPFQKLRTSLLFFLQLLALLAFVLAMGDPVVEDDLGSSTRMIILIDQSASMQAVLNNDDNPTSETRLQRAKKLGVELADRFLSSNRKREVMVIAFARRTRIATGFQRDRREVRRAIEAISPSDEIANLATALDLASAFSITMEETDTVLPRVALITDGSVGQPDVERGSFVIQADDVQVIRVDQSRDSTRLINNIAIVSLDARRNLDDPLQVDLFARFINTTPDAQTATVTLRIDDRVRSVQTLKIPGTEVDANGISTGPVGEHVQSFEFELTEGGIITLSHGTRDLLSSDDVASVVLQPPTSPTIAIVSEGSTPDPLIDNLLRATEPMDVIAISKEEYLANQESTDSDDPLAETDFVVFDRVALETLPDRPSIHFGSSPPSVEPLQTSDARQQEDSAGRRIVSWDRRHPLMRHVSLDDVIFSGGSEIRLPAEEHDAWDVLASSQDGPAIVASNEARDGPHVFVQFPLRNSNWLTQVGLLVFIQNILDAASLGRSANDGRNHQPGDTIDVQVINPREAVQIFGPISTEVEATSERDSITLPQLPLAGVYSVLNATPNTIAVNVASVEESDIRPQPDVVIRTQASDNSGQDSIGRRQLWPWFVAAGLVILMIEWWLYARRTRF